MGIFGFSKKKARRVERTTYRALEPVSMAVKPEVSEIFCMTDRGTIIKMVDHSVKCGVKVLTASPDEAKSAAIAAFESGHDVEYTVNGQRRSLQEMVENRKVIKTIACVR